MISARTLIKCGCRTDDERSIAGRNEDANRAFSVAVQMHDTLVKGWALWGEFMEQQFTSSSPPDISIGISAVTCFLHACRNQNESRSRKYLAKVKQMSA